jgi:hypothetical protein
MRSLFLLLSLFIAAGTSARDLAQYDKGGTFDFPLYPSSDAEQKMYQRDNAGLREFVWAHWSQRRRGYVRVIHHGVEGQSFIGDHYIEPDGSGRWSMSWDSEEPMRIYSVEQIRPRTDFRASRWRFEWMGYAGRFWKPGQPLAHAISGDGTKYMLQLRDKKGAIVALF